MKELGIYRKKDGIESMKEWRRKSNGTVFVLI
jgi:hypothetical protein